MRMIQVHKVWSLTDSTDHKLFGKNLATCISALKTVPKSLGKLSILWINLIIFINVFTPCDSYLSKYFSIHVISSQIFLHLHLYRGVVLYVVKYFEAQLFQLLVFNSEIISVFFSLSENKRKFQKRKQLLYNLIGNNQQLFAVFWYVSRSQLD